MPQDVVAEQKGTVREKGISVTQSIPGMEITLKEPSFALAKIYGPDLEQPVFFWMDLQVEDDPVSDVLVEDHCGVSRLELRRT